MVTAAVLLATQGDASAYFARRLAGLPYERLYAAHLDGAGRVLGETVADGDPGHVPLDLRRVIADALRLDARTLVLAHNHPGGCDAPSREDLIATRRLAEVANALRIRLADHLIVLPDGGTLSFRALGLL